MLNPILKWPGGKRRLLPEIRKYMPELQGCRFVDVFVGGGAVFMSLMSNKLLINDVNPELINFYQVVKSNPEALIESNKKHTYTSEYYYGIRNLDRKIEYKNMSPVDKASRFLFLNKTCYNGLCRYNSRGENNTPIGRYKNPDFIQTDAIMALSDYFNRIDADIRLSDFETVIDSLQEGDVAYLDPPYDTDSNGFTTYSAGGFSRIDQERLACALERASEKGVQWCLSNSATSWVLNRYSCFNLHVIQAPRNISCKGDKRQSVEEVIVTNGK